MSFNHLFQKTVFVTFGLMVSVSTSVAAGTEKTNKFSCQLTKYIEAIDGSMQARDRKNVWIKNLPNDGVGRYEEVVSEGAEAGGKKFRVQAKVLHRGNGQWSIEQQLYQVLPEGEREGKELQVSSHGKWSSLEILRTTEQVHRGVPKTEFRLNCVVKVPTEEKPLFAQGIDLETNLETSGESVDISQRQKMAGIVIPYSPIFIQKNAKLDPKIFNREIDPDPRLAEKPVTVKDSSSRSVASSGTKSENGWREVWPFRWFVKPINPVKPEAVTSLPVPEVKRQVVVSVRPIEAQSEKSFRKKVSPTFAQYPLVLAPQRLKAQYKQASVSTVPLVLAPQKLKRELLAFRKSSNPLSKSGRAPASESNPGIQIKPSFVNGVPTVPTPLIRVWEQYRNK